jgi:organic radical activating enzyme
MGQQPTIIPPKGGGANLLITSLCNLSCPYCFLKGWITSDATAAQHMSLSDLNKIITWMQGMGFDNVKLLGGEPTLHPQFITLVQRLLDRRVGIDCILTNGLADTQLYETIHKMVDTTWLVNVNHPSTYSAEQWERLNRNLELLKWKERGGIKQMGVDAGPLRLQLAITFYKPDQDYSYIIEMAKKYGSSFIRYAPSHPSADMSNEYVDFDNLILMKRTLLNFFNDCAKEGIRPNLECVLPACIFTQKELTYLGLFTENALFECSPHMDIMPDLTVTYCSSMKDVLPKYVAGKMGFDEMLSRSFRDAISYKAFPLARCRGCQMFKSAYCQGYCLRYKVEFVERARLAEPMAARKADA